MRTSSSWREPPGCRSWKEAGMCPPNLVQLPASSRLQWRQLFFLSHDNHNLLNMVIPSLYFNFQLNILITKPHEDKYFDRKLKSQPSFSWTSQNAPWSRTCQCFSMCWLIYRCWPKPLCSGPACEQPRTALPKKVEDPLYKKVRKSLRPPIQRGY